MRACSPICADACTGGWWQTDDPLLRGPIAPPVGARINSQSQRSADEPTQLIEEVGAPSVR